MCAVTRGGLSLVDNILNRPGVEVNVQDIEGNTALNLTEKHDVINRLLRAPGIDPTIPNECGNTFLHKLMLRYANDWSPDNDHGRFLKHLLEDRRIDMHQENKQGLSPYDLAERSGVKWLKDMFDAADEKRRSPYAAASRIGKVLKHVRHAWHVLTRTPDPEYMGEKLLKGIADSQVPEEELVILATKGARLNDEGWCFAAMHGRGQVLEKTLALTRNFDRAAMMARAGGNAQIANAIPELKKIAQQVGLLPSPAPDIPAVPELSLEEKFARLEASPPKTPHPPT